MQFTILELVLVIVAFATAVVAIFGYQAIKGGAEAKATDSAREYLEENGRDIIREEVQRMSILATRPSYDVDEADNSISNTEVENESGV